MKPRVIFIGALPPPFMGPTLATEVILKSSLKDRFELIHLDTSDHRGIETLGAFDFENIFGAPKGYWQVFWMSLRYRPALVYPHHSQTTLGYLKDSIMIIVAKLLGRRVVGHLRGGNWRSPHTGGAPQSTRHSVDSS